MWPIYSSSSGLCWRGYIIGPMAMEQPWRIMGNRPIPNHHKIQQCANRARIFVYILQAQTSYINVTVKPDGRRLYDHINAVEYRSNVLFIFHLLYHSVHFINSTSIRIESFIFRIAWWYIPLGLAWVIPYLLNGYWHIVWQELQMQLRCMPGMDLRELYCLIDCMHVTTRSTFNKVGRLTHQDWEW